MRDYYVLQLLFAATVWLLRLFIINLWAQFLPSFFFLPLR